jgi:hypothetical protein
MSIVDDLDTVLPWCEVNEYLSSIRVITVFDEFGEGNVRLSHETLAELTEKRRVDGKRQGILLKNLLTSLRLFVSLHFISHYSRNCRQRIYESFIGTALPIMKAKSVLFSTEEKSKKSGKN